MKYISLYEELFGRLYDGGVYYEVYKNPLSVKRFSNDIRGIIVENGDLYVVDEGSWSVIHKDLARYLNSKGIKISNDPYEVLSEVVMVQRKGMTNDFYLGETYREFEISDYFEDIERIVGLCRIKNPTINFILTQDPSF